MTGKSTKGKARCLWCPENEYRCQSDDVVATCDFRTLARTKVAVVERLSKEREFLEQATKAKDIDEDMALVTLDRLAGMTTMIKYLKENFKMTDEEIQKAMGAKKLGWIQKTKLLMKMKAMERSRGGR